MINMQVRDSYNKIALSRETAEEIWERALESAKTLPSERRNHRGKNKGKNLAPHSADSGGDSFPDDGDCSGLGVLRLREPGKGCIDCP